jgi:hypothetical protein
MRPFAFSHDASAEPIVRDVEHRDGLLAGDTAFFKARGIDLDAYRSETAAIDDTRTSYEKSTATPKGNPNPYDSDLDGHTKLDHPDKE